MDQSSQYTNSGAKKIDGCDSEIKLNGITYTSSLNTYSINRNRLTHGIRHQIHDTFQTVITTEQ